MDSQFLPLFYLKILGLDLMLIFYAFNCLLGNANLLFLIGVTENKNIYPAAVTF